MKGPLLNVLSLVNQLELLMQEVGLERIESDLRLLESKPGKQVHANVRGMLAAAARLRNQTSLLLEPLKLKALRQSAERMKVLPAPKDTDASEARPVQSVEIQAKE
jgi:hypothetical protein